MNHFRTAWNNDRVQAFDVLGEWEHITRNRQPRLVGEVDVVCPRWEFMTIYDHEIDKIR